MKRKFIGDSNRLTWFNIIGMVCGAILFPIIGIDWTEYLEKPFSLCTHVVNPLFASAVGVPVGLIATGILSLLYEPHDSYDTGH